MQSYFSSILKQIKLIICQDITGDIAHNIAVVILLLYYRLLS